MEPNRTKLTLLNLAVLLLAGTAALGVALTSHVLTATVATMFCGVGLFVTLLSYVLMQLLEREKNERLEYDELTKSPTTSALFNKDETSGLPARRSREQFEKFVVPGFTLALFLGEGAGVFFLWRWLQKPVVAME